jgi:disulfide bond formation protein DsbB
MSLRKMWGIGLGLSLLVLALAFYLQIYQNEAPCTLCILERISLMFSACIALLACWHNPKKWGQLVYLILSIAMLAFGIFFASRHVYLQIMKPSVYSCGPNLYLLLQMFPLDQALKIILQGTSDCIQQSWKFLGLSLADWSLINFIVLLGLNICGFKAWRKPA